MKCPRPRLVIAAAMLVALLACGGQAEAATADPLEVTLDQALVVKLPGNVATIVVGNPLIADVSLQPGGMLVVTGKGYGTTNVLALDQTGAVLMERAVFVSGPERGVIVVYRGPKRETYSCQPNCEQRVTLGDETAYFNAAITQTNVRNERAQGGAPRAR